MPHVRAHPLHVIRAAVMINRRFAGVERSVFCVGYVQGGQAMKIRWIILFAASIPILITTGCLFVAQAVTSETGRGFTWGGLPTQERGHVTLKWSHDAGAGVTSSPAISSDGTIYFGAWSGDLHALNVNGTLKWKFKAKDGIGSSPSVAADGTIYFGSWDDHLYAVDRNGKTKWKFKTRRNINSSPAIGDDGTVYIGSDDDNLYAVSKMGSLKWKFETGGNVRSSPAIGQDGIVYSQVA